MLHRWSSDPGPIGERLVGDVLAIAPGIKEVLADRGFTQLPESFNRPLHPRGLDITMDYKSDMASVAKHVQVGTGTNRQRLITTQGMFFPPWLPHRFFTVPPGLSFSQRRDWYASRAKFRWSVHKRLPGGDIQFICPQCAGRVVTNLKTHKKNVTANKSAPFVHVPGSGTCCKGLATVPVDRLDHWQPIPWKTRAWRKRYPRRNQVENVNGMVREDGGLRPAFCRVKGLAAHTLSALALALAHNLHLQVTDPLANHTTDADDVASDGDTADSHPPSEDAGVSANTNTDLTKGTTGGLRAPP